MQLRRFEESDWRRTEKRLKNKGGYYTQMTEQVGLSWTRVCVCVCGHTWFHSDWHALMRSARTRLIPPDISVRPAQ